MNASMILSFERDINDPLITFCPATLLARGDQNANIIRLTVMDGNAPADLSGNTAVVLFQRPGDSYVVRCPGSVSGNVISVTLLGDCYLYAGQYYASLILNADGFTRTMLRLAGHIESNGDGPIIDPAGTIPGYEDIARIYAELEASLGRSDAATDSANAAAQNATRAAGAANTAAGAANTAAGNANKATSQANAAADSIEGLTVEASDVSYDQPATATVTDVEGHKHIAFGLRQGVPGAVPSITFTGETGEPNTDVVITQSGPPEAPVVNLKIPQGVPGTGNVSTVDSVEADSGGNVELSAVRYVAQTLEDAQKVQARKNIGVDGQIYPCTATALEDMTQEQQAELYTQGYRAIKTENNGTVVLMGLAADGSLEWLGYNPPRGNLLDNPDFAIAQAGYGGTHGTQVYAADRWKGSGTGATFAAGSGGGITITCGTDAAGCTQVVAETPAVGEHFSFVVVVGGVPLIASGAWTGTAQDATATSGTITATVNAGSVQISVSSGSATVDYCMLLYGSYTDKTLPPWEVSDYISELAKCQRRYFKTIDGRQAGYTMYCQGVTVLYGGIKFPVEMRITPTISNIICTDLFSATDTTTGLSAQLVSAQGFCAITGINGTIGNVYSVGFEACADD